MKKIIKKFGGSVVIILNKEDQFIYNLQEGDIVDIVLSEKPERKETKRSLGNTIATLYQIEKIKRIILEIIPMEEQL